MNNLDRMVRQGTSGRWLLTLIAGVCLLLLTLADLRAVMQDKPPPISVEAIFSIITMVFVAYFNKPTEKPEKSEDPPKP